MTTTATKLTVAQARQQLLDALDGKAVPDEAELLDAWWGSGTEWAVPGAVLSDDELSITDYHLGPGVSSSGLSKILDAVVLYHDQYIREANSHTPAKVLGSAINDAVLQPDKFDRDYIRVEVDGRLTKSDKSAIARDVGPRGLYLRSSSIATGGGTLYVSVIDGDGKPALEPIGDHHVTRGTVALDASCYEEVERLRDACYAHPKLGRILGNAGTECELSYYGRDPETGILCRCRADIATPSRFVLDFKTAADASWEAFRGAAFRYGYHTQAALYPSVVEWCTGQRPEAFAWVVFDKRILRPEMIALHYPDEEMLREGWARVRSALDRLNDWIEQAGNEGIAGAWSGYPQDFQVIPRYRSDREER